MLVRKEKTAVERLNAGGSRCEKRRSSVIALPGGITPLLLLLLALFSTISELAAVDRSKFRTCADTGFCRRFRGTGSAQGPVFNNQHYKLDVSSARHGAGEFTAKVVSPNAEAPLNLKISFYGSGSVRMKISEDAPRWQPTDLLLDDGSVLRSYSALAAGDKRLPPAAAALAPDSFFALAFSSSSDLENVLLVHCAPLKIELFRGGMLQLSVNERSLLHYEQSAAAPAGRNLAADGALSDEERHGGKTVVDYGEDGLAVYADGTKEERRELSAGDEAQSRGSGDSFGGHVDSAPLGARSVGVDVAFPYAQHVYGLPEHTTPLSLPTTAPGSAQRQPAHSEPFRMYTLDVFEYEIGNTMSLYGTIPLLLAHGLSPAQEPVTTGVFWFNPSETFIDITDGSNGDSSSSGSYYKQSRWLSESGEVDLFILPGPSAAAIYSQYTALTGTQQLPPLFSLGYHQCRWNYRDERDVAAVETGFEELDFPMDVIWLDIEHTDSKKYFTWDQRLFPNPLEMQRNVSRHGRKMVTIVDPHIKRDDSYWVHKDALSKGLYIRDKNGGVFDGWCWPGASSYLDFTAQHVREWWAQQFSLDKYVGSTLDLFTWNDMNEPSVFNGPEVSMPKDCKNLQGVEHRDWHNLYGLYMQMATALGLTQRSPAATVVEQQHALRPFVLTRSFWAGSQRFGAMWTGDNTAKWSHLQIAAPMLLSINLGGLSFAGADVGGFFGDPSAELFTRWFQAGAFTPFFRGHAHHDTKRREPWLFGEPYTQILRQAAMQRYSLLPYWYSVFFEAYATGLPVMRPLFLEFPADASTFELDAQWMVGAALLVAPVVHEKQTSVRVYFPAHQQQPWYELESLAAVQGVQPDGYCEVQAPLEKLPVFIRAGSVVPRKMRLRRSSKLMHYDPYTIVVAPSQQQMAEGALYLDDEYSLAHETIGAFALRQFKFVQQQGVATLTCSSAPLPRSAETAAETSSTAKSAALTASPSASFSAANTVERVLIAGQRTAPKRVTVLSSAIAAGAMEGKQSEVELTFTHDSATQVLTIKKPAARVIDDWTIHITF